MTQHSLIRATTPRTLPVEFRTPVPVPRLEPKQCVLIVDANPLSRQAVRTVLELAGFGVLVAAHAQACMRVLCERDVSALIIDASLPGVDGPQLVRFLRGNPTLARLPCLLLSGSDDRDDEVRGLEAGADDFIIKSDGFLVLTHRLRAHLRRKAAEDVARHQSECRHRGEVQLIATRAAHEADELRRALRASIELHATEIESLRRAEPSHTCPDLLSELSDALREPLNTIVGFAELLRDEQFGHLGHRQRDFVRRIVDGGRTQLGLVNALIDLTHLETGRLRLARSPIAVGLLADAVANVVRDSARSRQVQLQLTVPPDLPLAFADPTRIRQVLHSILTMSLCDAGLGSTLHLHASVCGHGLEIAVTHSGNTQGHEDDEPGVATVRRLTFAVARRLAELHGGSLGATGQGTELILRLPSVAAGTH